VLGQEPDTLDAHKTGAYVSGVVHRYIGDTLIHKSPQGEILPALAESYEASEDGLTWTFTMKEGIIFHDGAVCDANAVKACYDRALDPEIKSAVTIGQLGPIDTITALDDKTVEFKHTESNAVFFDNMAHPVCSILNAEAAAAAGDDFGRAPVLTGPWKLMSWEAGVEIVMERNADYAWPPQYATHDGPPYIQDLIIKIFPETATAVTALEAGEVDQIEINQADIQRIKDTGEYETIEFYRPGATFMEFNVTKAPFDDLNVRKAFNHIFDRQAILDASLEGYGRLLYSCLPESIWGWWDGSVDYAYPMDHDKALEYFGMAGWTKEGDQLVKDGQQFSFVFTTISGNQAQSNGAQVIQAQLRDFGIAMEIKVTDFTTVISDLKAGNYEVSYIGYAYASPDIVYIWFHSDNIGTGLTLSQNNSPELDALIDESRSNNDLDRRLELYKEIQIWIIDNALHVPLYEASTTYGLQPRIAGHLVHPDGHLHLADAYITDL
jgi:peptide/nickel transport system substrate-binding protein